MMRVLNRVFIVLIVIAGLGLAACHKDDAPEIETAVAYLTPTQGSHVTGVIRFQRDKNGIRVLAEVQGLRLGKHGFHIHQYGDCSAADASSAGGHFNPDGMPHGGPNDKYRHVGDLGNISADETGYGRADNLDQVISFEGPNSIIGHAVILHTHGDDLSSQPSGDAGSRVACGVVGISQ